MSFSRVAGRRLQVWLGAVAAGAMTANAFAADPVGQTAPELDAAWRATAADAKGAVATINWTMGRMAEICGDKETVENFKTAAKTSKKAEAPADPGSARNLYGPEAIAARDLVTWLEENRKPFCKAHYYDAMKRGRLAAVAYAEGAAKRDRDDADRQTYVKQQIASATAKSARLGAAFTNADLSTDERLADICLHKWPGDSKAIVSCFWEAKEMTDKAAGGDAALAQSFIEAAFGSGARAHSSSAAIVTSYRSPGVDIRAECEREWGGDYRMREHCEKEQEKAQSAIADAQVPEDIAKRCDGDWANSYTMRKHCYSEQIAAKQRRGY